MHDGSLASLDEVLDYYDRGGNPNSGLDPELRSLRLTIAEKQALVAFLRSLSVTVREGRRRRPKPSPRTPHLRRGQPTRARAQRRELRRRKRPITSLTTPDFVP